jgi:hypothetical protein
MLQEVTLESLTAHYAAVRARLGYRVARPVLRLVPPASDEKGRRLYVEPIGPANNVLWTQTRKIIDAYGGGLELPKTRRVKIEIAKFWDVTVADIEGDARFREYIMPRQECMYVYRTFFGLSWAQCGNHLGRRDHTTALHGYRSFGRYLARGGRAWCDTDLGRAWLADAGFACRS